jgi:uncharacterized protein
MIIDAFAFARNNQQLVGTIILAALKRLDLVKRDGSLDYQVRGYVGERGRSFLELKVQGALVLRCERCLQPLDWPLNLRSVLWLAASEEEADAEPVDRDEYDPVVGSAQFNLDAMIEDEVLLAIPVVPKHDRCPSLAAPKDEAQSPFAVLAQLKKGGSDTPTQ